jgi:hypothetical protein
LIHKSWKFIETNLGWSRWQYHQCFACEKVVYDERREDHQALMQLVLEQRNSDYLKPPVVHWKDETEEASDQGASRGGWGTAIL